MEHNDHCSEESLNQEEPDSTEELADPSFKIKNECSGFGPPLKTYEEHLAEIERVHGYKHSDYACPPHTRAMCSYKRYKQC